MASNPSKSARPPGTWPSIITSESMTQSSLRLSSPSFGEDGDIFWIEGRPQESGRGVLVHRDSRGRCRDLTPAPFNVRSTVHEYGGTAYAVHGNDVYFVDGESGQICHTPLHTPQGPITRISEGESDWRFVDLQVDHRHKRLIAVGEKHGGDRAEPFNAIVGVPLEVPEARPEILASGADFYSSPRLSPQQDRLVWLQWNHPHMPWDAAALYGAGFSPQGHPEPSVHIAGTDKACAFGPTFNAKGDLYVSLEHQDRFVPHFLSALDLADGRSPRPLPCGPGECALPLWQFGMSTVGPLDEQSLACAFTNKGLWRVDVLRKGGVQTLDLPFVAISHLTARDGQILLLGASADATAGLILVNAQDGQWQCLQSTATVDTRIEAYVSAGQPLSFATTDGDTAHGFFYPPHNPHYEAWDDAKPPLVVLAHSGPTAAAGAGLNLAIQFWTTRGLAVLDVNYRGSTGYGRAYRDRLAGQWGIYDVQDCCAGARALAQAGKVDGARMAIRGSSAGGFTVLSALAFHDDFAAGCSLYGVSDLSALARDTHKFESHYTDKLVGPYPEFETTYRERSPLFAAEKFSAPVLFMQGLQDKVVPPAQAETMVEALAMRGIPVAYLTFAEEAHGFRAAATLKAAVDAELSFYGQVFRFEPADTIAAVVLQNAQALQE